MIPPGIGLETLVGQLRLGTPERTAAVTLAVHLLHQHQVAAFSGHVSANLLERIGAFARGANVASEAGPVEPEVRGHLESAPGKDCEWGRRWGRYWKEREGAVQPSSQMRLM